MALINIDEQTNVSQESILVGCIPPTFVVGGLGGMVQGVLIVGIMFCLVKFHTKSLIKVLLDLKRKEIRLCCCKILTLRKKFKAQGF